tara:strand:- start:40 stop:333 length:294 start_codon:yes stop_codon:yes gene_type:complete
MATQDWSKAVIVHGHANHDAGHKTEATGSFTKLFSTGSGVTSVLDVIEFGSMTQPESAFTASAIITDFTMVQGAYLDGPIARFRVKSGSAGVVAYVK